MSLHLKIDRVLGGHYQLSKYMIFRSGCNRHEFFICLVSVDESCWSKLEISWKSTTSFRAEITTIVHILSSADLLRYGPVGSIYNAMKNVFSDLLQMISLRFYIKKPSFYSGTGQTRRLTQMILSCFESQWKWWQILFFLILNRK